MSTSLTALWFLIVGILGVIIGVLYGAGVWDVQISNYINTDLQTLVKMKKECELTIPRNQKCKGTVKFIIVEEK